MAKRFDKGKKNDRLERTVMRNWIILGVSAALIIFLLFCNMR